MQGKIDSDLYFSLTERFFRTAYESFNAIVIWLISKSCGTCLLKLGLLVYYLLRKFTLQTWRL